MCGGACWMKSSRLIAYSSEWRVVTKVKAQGLQPVGWDGLRGYPWKERRHRAAGKQHFGELRGVKATAHKGKAFDARRS